MRRIYRQPGAHGPAAIGSPQFIPAPPGSGSGAVIFGCWNDGVRQQTEKVMQKVLVDFSFAAALALFIGIAVGGTAFSLVWLIAVLNA